MGTLLAVEDLVVNFYTYRGVVKALDGINLAINRGETMGLVGETGCGKSVTARAIIRLIDNPGKIEDGRILLEGMDLLSLPEPEMRKVRGRKISFIFQEPKKALDPTATVGAQMEEAFIMATGSGQEQARALAGQILAKVGLADPQRVLESYSFELSGGMAQRIMIGMAVSGHPQLVIADEPTSALDVSVQAVIINLIMELQAELRLSCLFITHDLNLLRFLSNRLAIMYLGLLVEVGGTKEVFSEPLHPYSRALIASTPQPKRTKHGPKIFLEGEVPSNLSPPPGCRFHTRCPEKIGKVCETECPELKPVAGRLVACHLYRAEPPACRKKVF